MNSRFAISINDELRSNIEVVISIGRTNTEGVHRQGRGADQVEEKACQGSRGRNRTFLHVLESAGRQTILISDVGLPFS
jgi:hypothetical protein